MLDGWPPPLFDPAGPYAWPITLLGWVLLAMAAAIMLLVTAALYVAVFGKEPLRSRLGGTRIIWAGGIVLPVLVLTVLLIYGLSLTRQLSAAPDKDSLRVRVTGEMWWWRVGYLDRQGRIVLHDANEIHIPVGRKVLLELESADVIHSFWVPQLAGKLDMVPGRRNAVVIQADRPGIFKGQCAEFCGGPHALMGFVVIAHPADFFDRWMDRRLAREASAPSPGGTAARGAQLFGSSGCAACHRIAGTDANGLAGPDLTYVGSRRTLGSGILPNNRGTMMGWIANSQAIKPGNRMPAYTVMPGEDVAAMAAYLEAQQ